MEYIYIILYIYIITDDISKWNVTDAKDRAKVITELWLPLHHLEFVRDGWHVGWFLVLELKYGIMLDTKVFEDIGVIMD